MYTFKKPDIQIENLHENPLGEFKGYFRMYFRNGWQGRWFGLDKNKEPTIFASIQDSLASQDIGELKEIIKIIASRWENGCDNKMINDLKTFNSPWGENRHLLQVAGENITFLLCIDTTYKNDDYPIRIYLYK